MKKPLERRLHDINRSGWFRLLSFFVLVGFVALIVWCCTAPEEGVRTA